MKELTDTLITFATFDIVRLRGRLAKIEDPDMRAALVIFTLLADGVRFFLITCLFALVLI
ncbi:MAG: hypothetical protein O7I42_22130 [Alphaproteobacteria bacterium]|nr:hypothetical protein [Alphaproteobacteria bacterium]